MCVAVCNAAENLLPKLSPQKKTHKDYIKDDYLSKLSQASKVAWKFWKQPGRPWDGQLMSDMKRAKKEVRNRIYTGFACQKRPYAKRTPGREI